MSQHLLLVCLPHLLMGLELWQLTFPEKGFKQDSFQTPITAVYSFPRGERMLAEECFSSQTKYPDYSPIHSGRESEKPSHRMGFEWYVRMSFYFWAVVWFYLCSPEIPTETGVLSI